MDGKVKWVESGARLNGVDLPGDCSTALKVRRLVLFWFWPCAFGSAKFQARVGKERAQNLSKRALIATGERICTKGASKFTQRANFSPFICTHNGTESRYFKARELLYANKFRRSISCTLRSRRWLRFAVCSWRAKSSAIVRLTCTQWNKHTTFAPGNQIF